MNDTCGSRGVGLYDGRSNRSRGWKSRRLGDDPDKQTSSHMQHHTREMAARTARDWEHLRKDQDLWYSTGTCSVYFNTRGHAQDAPEIRLPLSGILAANLQPLIDQARDRETGTTQQQRLDTTDDSVDLYFPAPIGATRSQVLQYQVRMRNVFAWAFSKPLVGQHLGGAFVDLVSTLDDIRKHSEGAVCAVRKYLETLGYTTARDRPGHALALLYFAEQLQLNDLYTNAFAHCVGMSDALPANSEYEYIGETSRRLIRHHAGDMGSRLRKAGTMLRTFLEDDLSESHLGLSAGSRTHLDRFRSHIHSHYMTQFGYYPPLTVQSGCTMFEPAVYQRMRADFGALYEYLVDRSFSITSNSGFVSNGGICTLQNVHTFDLRHKFRSLQHPLPLIPSSLPDTKMTRKGSIFRPSKRSEKLDHEQLMLAHEALIRSTNATDARVLANPLVASYRRFEEQSIFRPQRADRDEKVGLADARKLRWLVIYCIYQTLRSCTDIPTAVLDTADLTYHLCLAPSFVLPWADDNRPTRRLSPPSTATGSVTTLSTISVPTTPTKDMDPPAFEIKPDIDYIGLDKRATSCDGDSPPLSSCGSQIQQPIDASKLRGRRNTFRKSINMLKAHAYLDLPSSPTTPTSPNSIALEHLILGYDHDDYLHTSITTSHKSTESLSSHSMTDSRPVSSDSIPNRSSSTSSCETVETQASSLSLVLSTTSNDTDLSDDTTLGPRTPRDSSLDALQPQQCHGPTKLTIVGLGDYHLDLEDDDEDEGVFPGEAHEVVPDSALPLNYQLAGRVNALSLLTKSSSPASLRFVDLGPPSSPPSCAPPDIPQKSHKRRSIVSDHDGSRLTMQTKLDHDIKLMLERVQPPRSAEETARRRRGTYVFEQDVISCIGTLPEDSNEWTDVQMGTNVLGTDFMSEKDFYSQERGKDDEIHPVWEQFADLGGLCSVSVTN